MKSRKIVHQAGVVALCGGEICLVTNGSGRNWTIPKGHVEPGMTSREAALMECFEEAGLTGVLGQEPLGTYAYKKNGHSHVVTVYILMVSEVLSEWPESKRRHRSFLPPALAADKITNLGLCALLNTAQAQSERDWPREKRPQSRLRVATQTP